MYVEEGEQSLLSLSIIYVIRGLAIQWSGGELFRDQSMTDRATV